MCSVQCAVSSVQMKCEVSHGVCLYLYIKEDKGSIGGNNYFLHWKTFFLSRK